MRGNRVAVRWSKRTSLVGVLLLLFSLLNVSAALAAVVQLPLIEVNDTIVDTPGTIHEVADRDVAPEFQGLQCTVVAEGLNQESVHPGTNIIVESGGTTVVVTDAERTPQQVTQANGLLTLGDEVVVSIEIGSDGVVSVDHLLHIECNVDPLPGRIIVVKQVTDGSDTTQAFQFSASFDTDGFALSDGQQNDSGDLIPGTYSVSETVPGGWTLQSAVCDDQSTPDAIDLSAGETVTCTFTNAEDAPPPPPDLGRIIVIKQVASGSTTQTFQFTAGYDADGFVLSHGQQNVSADLQPGIYTVDETPLQGWTVESAVCDDGSTPAAIDLSAGETVTCTFTNSEIPTVVGASILVTVGGSCTVSGTEGVGHVTVTMSVAGGADVVISDSSGDVVGTLTADGSVDVPEGEVYTWVATPNPGFEFPAGFDNTGSVSIETCSNPEVLPFTGLDTDGLSALGIVLVIAGGMTLLTSRTSLRHKP